MFIIPIGAVEAKIMMSVHICHFCKPSQSTRLHLKLSSFRYSLHAATQSRPGLKGLSRKWHYPVQANVHQQHAISFFFSVYCILIISYYLIIHIDWDQCKANASLLGSLLIFFNLHKLAQRNSIPWSSISVPWTHALDPPHQASLCPLVSSPLSHGIDRNWFPIPGSYLLGSKVKASYASYCSLGSASCSGIAYIHHDICCIEIQSIHRTNNCWLMISRSKLDPLNKSFKAVLQFAAARAPLEVRKKLHPSVVCPNDAASAFLGEAERQPFEVVYPILAVTLQNYANAHAVMNHSSNKGIYQVDSDWVHQWDLIIS